MEFDESRPYAPGDDARNLDWRVTARTSKPHTKLFREERERPVFLAVDYRASMHFATQGAFKSVVAARLAALLAWASEQRGDRLGGSIFSEAGSQEFRPQRGRRAVLRWLNGLVLQAGGTQADALSNRSGSVFQESLARLPIHARPGSLVFVLSDFRQLDPAGIASLSRLAQHSEVVLVFIFDPLEQYLPEGRLSFAYGTRQISLATDARIREQHTASFLQRRAALQQLALRNRMHFLSCSTQDDPLKILGSHRVNQSALST